MATWNKRRTFLGAIAALSLGIGLGRWFYRPRQIDDPWTEQTATTVRRLLPYLQIDEDGLARFAQDLLARDQHALLRRASAGHAQAEAWLGQQFLLSSDFFWHGADGGKDRRLPSLLRPLRTPLRQPFRPLGVSRGPTPCQPPHCWDLGRP